MCAFYISIAINFFDYDINKLPHALYEYGHVGDTYIGLVYLFFRVFLCVFARKPQSSA